MSRASLPLSPAPTEPSPSVDVPMTVPWTGLLGREGSPTGDGRLIEENALSWLDGPSPLRYVPMDMGAHDGAYVVGQITSISRSQGGKILGKGFFDLASPYGEEAMRCVKDKRMDGVSLDLDDVSFEIRVRPEVMGGDAPLSEDDAPEAPLDSGASDSPDSRPVNPDGTVTVVEVSSTDELMVTTSARIRAATLVAIPAFVDARIELVDTPDESLPGEEAPSAAPPSEGVDTESASEQSDELTAGITMPDSPPTAWFSDPGLVRATALTVTPEGRVYGHLATWGTCHLSHTHNGCVTPPHSAASYAYFHTGAVLTCEGAEVPVGHITLDTTHAGTHLSAAAASTHYENTGAVVADVTAGEDSVGIWVAGALRPTVTDAQMRALRSSPLSGDWRRLSGTLELVAALAVNVPGFPVPRPCGLVAGGVTLSLVASGMVPPRKVRRPGTLGALSTDDLRYLKRLADRERAEEKRSLTAPSETAVRLARRVRASALCVRTSCSHHERV